MDKIGGPERGGDEDGTVGTRVRGRLGDLTPSEKRAAHVLLSSYPFAGLETVAQFAARAGVSAPSILRFVARFGFKSYAEFQRRLKDELEAQLNSPLARAGQVSRDTSFGAFAEAARQNVEATFAGIAPATFEGAVDLLGDARRRLHVVGGRFSEALALYMVRHLRIVRGDVTGVDGQASTWRDQVIDFGKRDVLIAFDIRRYQDDVVSFAEEAAERGATIILLTDQWLSPIARHARHVFAAQTSVPSPWDSSCALLAVSEALIAAVTSRSRETTEARLKALEELRRRGGPGGG